MQEGNNEATSLRTIELADQVDLVYLMRLNGRRKDDALVISNVKFEKSAGCAFMELDCDSSPDVNCFLFDKCEFDGKMVLRIRSGAIQVPAVRFENCSMGECRLESNFSLSLKDCSAATLFRVIDTSEFSPHSHTLSLVCCAKALSATTDIDWHGIVSICSAELTPASNIKIRHAHGVELSAVVGRPVVTITGTGKESYVKVFSCSFGELNVMESIVHWLRVQISRIPKMRVAYSVVEELSVDDGSVTELEARSSASANTNFCVVPPIVTSINSSGFGEEMKASVMYVPCRVENRHQETVGFAIAELLVPRTAKRKDYTNYVIASEAKVIDIYDARKVVNVDEEYKVQSMFIHPPVKPVFGRRYVAMLSFPLVSGMAEPPTEFKIGRTVTDVYGCRTINEAEHLPDNEP